MRRTTKSLAVAAILAVPSLVVAQAQAGAADGSRSVAGGGIMAAGWAGKVDPAEEGRGMKLTDGKLTMAGNVMTVTTGPATTYWNPANKATGNYTVKATFNEPKFQNVNPHPHPYGIMIAGNDLGTDQQSFLYCGAYGNGKYLVRGFSGTTPFALTPGRSGDTSSAVNKAAGIGQPVSQEIAIAVKADKVECWINGKVVASYDKSAIVTAGKLKSTDGVFGIRFAHNTDATVTGLTMTKQ